MSDNQGRNQWNILIWALTASCEHVVFFCLWGGAEQKEQQPHWCKNSVTITFYSIVCMRRTDAVDISVCMVKHNLAESSRLSRSTFVKSTIQEELCLHWRTPFSSCSLSGTRSRLIGLVSPFVSLSPSKPPPFALRNKDWTRTHDCHYGVCFQL